MSSCSQINSTIRVDELYSLLRRREGQLISRLVLSAAAGG